VTITIEIRTDVVLRLESLILFARKDFEGVSSEVVTLGWISTKEAGNGCSTNLSLQKIRRKNFTSIAIKESEGCAERRSGDTPENGLRNDASPTRLRFMNG
jgi:hypothetical protein